jgi:hypothetical protein
MFCRYYNISAYASSIVALAALASTELINEWNFSYGKPVERLVPWKIKTMMFILSMYKIRCRLQRMF